MLLHDATWIPKPQCSTKDAYRLSVRGTVLIGSPVLMWVLM
jgi:hypothetical protein